MTTSTNRKKGMHRRYLPLIAATAAGALLLAACGPGDDEPTANEDTDAGVEGQGRGAAPAPSPWPTAAMSAESAARSHAGFSLVVWLPDVTAEEAGLRDLFALRNATEELIAERRHERGDRSDANCTSSLKY